MSIFLVVCDWMEDPAVYLQRNKHNPFPSVLAVTNLQSSLQILVLF